MVESTGYTPYGRKLNQGFQTQKSFLSERDDPGEADQRLIL
ncbi:hypothetical protein [Hoeflea marina]|nr:hypothetical protein [Hoeflea marina]